MNVRFLAAAEREALESAFRYEDQKPNLGNDFLAHVEQAWKSIAADPERFAIVEMPRSKRIVRSYALKRFPYVIYYEIRADEILLLAVAHTSRRPFYWKRRK